MVSRMEKYYKNVADVKQRSQKNRDLYREIYSYGEYSNIEGVATMEKNNEVDITKVQRMLKNRENYKRQKQYEQITKPSRIEVEEETIKKKSISRDFMTKEHKNYDIRDVLNKAKTKKPEEDTPRSLDNTNYNILKNLKLDNEKTVHRDFEDGELKELIDTITSTSLLNQMDNNELGLNMFDLADEDDHLNNSESIKLLLEQAKKYEDDHKNSNIDNSFFTSSLNFTKEDFEDAEGVEKKKKPKKNLIRLLVFFGLLLMTFIIIFFIFNLIK